MTALLAVHDIEVAYGAITALHGISVDVEEGLSFPLPSRSELEAYVIYVGFDEIGDKNEKRSAKSAKKPAARPQ